MFQDGPAGDMKAMEPVFHGGLPAVLWKNIFRAYVVKGAIDLAAGEGEVCKAAMLLRKPCVAFCFTDLHVRLLFDHLVSWMLVNMAEPNNTYYNATYKSFKAGQTAVAAPSSPAKPVPQKIASENSGKKDGTKSEKRKSHDSTDKTKKKRRRKDSETDSSSSD